MDFKMIKFCTFRKLYSFGVFLINIVYIDFTNGIHQVAVDYQGSGYVKLSSTSTEILDTEGFALRCIISSPNDIPITIGWHWRDSHAHNPDYYFTWTTSKSQRGSDFEYQTTLLWNSNITDTRKRTASGTIYAAGSHDDDTTETTVCSNISLTVIWPPTQPTVIHDDPIISGTTAVLKCETSDIGNPRSSVVWKKGSENYAGPGSTNTSLYLPVTKVDDMTSWRCYLYNMEGDSDTSDASILNVNWKAEQPNISSTSNNSNLRIGNTVNLRCIPTDDGNPDGHMKWTRNGAFTSFTEEPLSFTIKKDHNGDKWCCLVTNTLGDGPCSSDIYLTVYWEPDKPTLRSAPEFSDLNIGQKVNLSCQLTDKGNPQGQVVWLRDGTVMSGPAYTDATVDLFINLGHNGSEWCCYYNNSIGKGLISDCETLIITSNIPIPGGLMISSRTATSLNASIDNSRVHLDTFKLMNASWRSNTSMEVMHEIVHSNITYKLFDGLEPDTYYTIQFAFVHEGETGDYKEISDVTEISPINEDPKVTREWLSATCALNILNPDSDKKVVMNVCRLDGTNCIKETKAVTASKTSKRSIEEQEVRITITDNSFIRRLVKVTVYDTGVLVYDYSDTIDAPVAAIVLIVLGAVLIVAVIIIIIIIIIKKTGKKKPRKAVEEEISPYGHTNAAMTNQSSTGTGHETKARNAPPVISVVNKGKPLAPIAASPADGDVYSQVDWSKKTKRPSLKGLPMSKKAIDKITFSKKDGSINMHLEVSKKFTGEIGIDVCRDGDQTSKSKKSKQHVGGTKNVVMVLPIEDTSQDKYTISMKFIAKGQMVQELDLTYPYEQNAVHVTVMNDAYVTSGTDVKASEMPEYSEVNRSKKTKGSEMPIYSEVNKPKKKKKAAEEQPYEDVETKHQSSHNERSTNAVSPSNAEVAVEGVPPHPPRKGTPKEGVMYAELDLNSSGAPRLLPRLGSKSPAHEPVVYADVRPG